MDIVKTQLRRCGRATRIWMASCGELHCMFLRMKWLRLGTRAAQGLSRSGRRGAGVHWQVAARTLPGTD